MRDESGIVRNDESQKREKNPDTEITSDEEIAEDTKSNVNDLQTYQPVYNTEDTSEECTANVQDATVVIINQMSDEENLTDPLVNKIVPKSQDTTVPCGGIRMEDAGMTPHKRAHYKSPEAKILSDKTRFKPEQWKKKKVNKTEYRKKNIYHLLLAKQIQKITLCNNVATVVLNAHVAHK